MRLTTLSALAGSLVLAFSSIATATPPSATAAPVAAATARTTGTVTRYFVTPAGHVRGVVLDNGAIVLVHGRAVDALPRQLPVGHAVVVEGQRTPSTPVTFGHATIRDTAGHAYYIAPPPRAIGVGPATAAPRPGNAEGLIARVERLPVFHESSTINTVLINPHGKVYGLLLGDGASVVISRRMSNALRGHALVHGQRIAIEGRGGAFANGRSIFAEHITLADGTMLSSPLPLQASAR